MNFITKLSLTCFLISSHAAFALENIVCIPTKDTTKTLLMRFHKNIDPSRPIIGGYSLGMDLEIHSATKILYTKNDLRLVPIKNYSDFNLKFDNENIGVYLRLYPQFSEGTFVNYLGQIFVNDLSVRAYFNFKDSQSGPGFICQTNE